MAVSDTELEFLKFQTVADKVYQSLEKSYDEIQKILLKTERRIKISNTRPNLKQDSQISALVSMQNSELEELRKTVDIIRGNIDALHENSRDFSIVVYGRKMAGKSTLMEILTHGDGKTIGKGTQRTIFDIRSYHWNGLKITDISGFDFSSNDANAKAGIDAVKTADLILFLMTNNATLSEEAEVFARLKNFGKPIFGIVNVRKILNFKQRDLLLQDLNKILPNAKETAAVIEDFKKFSAMYNQDWSDIKFFPVHLLAAYYAQTDRINDKEIYTASNFVEFENFVLGKISKDGNFLHVKNFVDGVAIPMNDILQKLFKNAANSFIESKLWSDKNEEILTWSKSFNGDVKKQASKLLSSISENLNEEIPKFVNELRDNNQVNERWYARVKELGYINVYQNLLEDFLFECQNGIQKSINALTKGINTYLDGKTQTNFVMEDAAEFGSYFTAELPDLSTLLPNSQWTPPVQDDAGALFYQAFFDQKSNPNISKSNLIKQLTDSSMKIFTEIDETVRGIFNSKILPNVEEVSKILVGYSYMLAKLGEAQGEMAESLLDEYEKLNALLLGEALKQTGENKLTDIKVTLRIPGEIVFVIGKNSGVDEAGLSEVLGEKFYTMQPLKSWNDTMKTMLGCDFDLEEYSLDMKSGDKTYSVVPKEKLTGEIIKLTQQISPYPIINK